ncbi:UNVERIFIED_ORG: hypothetical protein GGD51_006041 [Rhizobium esperanzae]
MPIVREIALWISGIIAFFCIGAALGEFAEKLTGSSYREIATPLAVGLALFFVCLRLWILDRRTVRRLSVNR